MRVASATVVSVAVVVTVISGVVVRDFLRGHHNLNLIDATIVPGALAADDADRIEEMAAT